MAVVTPNDRPKSVRNRSLIEVFVAVLSRHVAFRIFSVSVGAFCIGLSQISSFSLKLGCPNAAQTFIFTEGTLVSSCE